MKKRNVTKFNKERITMMVSSFLIVAACAMTGVYVNQKEKENVDKQIIDFSQLERDTKADAGSLGVGITSDYYSDLDADPFFEETTGGSVINPGINSVSDNNIAEGEDEESEGEDLEKSEEEDTDEDSEKSSTKQTMSSPSYNFKESDGLGWPLPGNIILNYSMDKTVFFETLQQYKYNPAVIISANEGDSVSSPAKGKVTEVGTDEEIGNYIVINLGNGYEITIGQLKDITVKKDDGVERGQVIGKVGKPTKYFNVEGANVYLRITKDGIPISPLSMLE